VFLFADRRDLVRAEHDVVSGMVAGGSGDDARLANAGAPSRYATTWPAALRVSETRTAVSGVNASVR
jgi:hypothetical protein